MKAIADIVEQEAFPEFICFQVHVKHHRPIVAMSLQEVTRNILAELQRHVFWDHYHVSDIPPSPYFVLMLVRKDLSQTGPEFTFHPYANTEMGCAVLRMHRGCDIFCRSRTATGATGRVWQTDHDRHHAF